MNPNRPCLGPYRSADTIHEIGVEISRQSNALGEHGLFEGPDAVETFAHVHERDSQSCFLEGQRLHGIVVRRV